MADALFVLLVIAFFALMAGMVRFCDAVIGPDPDGLDRPEDPEDPEDPERAGVEGASPARSSREGGSSR